MKIIKALGCVLMVMVSVSFVSSAYAYCNDHEEEKSCKAESGCNWCPSKNGHYCSVAC